jgi:hypothetical protein
MVSEPLWRLALTLEDHGCSIIAKAKKVLGKVESCPGKPIGSRKLVQVVNYALVRPGSFDLNEVPDGGPEIGDVFDGPAVQLGIVGKIFSIAPVHLFQKIEHIGASNAAFRWFPQQLRHDSLPLAVEKRCPNLLARKKNPFANKMQAEDRQKAAGRNPYCSEY